MGGDYTRSATHLIMPVAGFAEHSHMLLWVHRLECIMCFMQQLQSLYSDGVVNLDELFAAGRPLRFALAYSVCQQIRPQSLTVLIDADANRAWMELLFTSFSIQSGTGMGDVMPIAKEARVIGIFQMFSAVIFLAVVVPRLAALTIKDK